MPLDDRNRGYLWDMLDAADAVQEFLRGKSYDDLVTNRMLRNAVERNLEILGEAARRVSEDVKRGQLEIPWRSMIGLRNVLAHEYDAVRYEVLWYLHENELPRLIDCLQNMGIGNPPSESE